MVVFVSGVLGSVHRKRKRGKRRSSESPVLDGRHLPGAALSFSSISGRRLLM
jgi:hypothetical protein